MLKQKQTCWNRKWIRKIVGKTNLVKKPANRCTWTPTPELGKDVINGVVTSSVIRNVLSNGKVIQNMVVGRILFRGARVDFSRRSQWFIQGGQIGEILFNLLETKRTTFLAENLIGKCVISKSRGGTSPPAPGTEVGCAGP